MVGIVGPDGVGKSTLMALIAGSKKMQAGHGHASSAATSPTSGTGAPSARASPTCRRAWARTSTSSSASTTTSTSWRSSSGCPPPSAQVRIKELLDATGPGPVPRPPGRQALGRHEAEGRPVRRAGPRPGPAHPRRADHRRRSALAAAVLDAHRRHPRRAARHERLISTAYMDEAQQWDWIVAMDAGRVLATGTPAELMAAHGHRGPGAVLHRAAARGEAQGPHGAGRSRPAPPGKPEIAIEAHGLTRRFGTFTAVDHVTLSIERGEIFGFLGSNGCGKSTTMKMLTGLLPPTEGTATLFGSSVEAGSMEVRKNLGYMTQAFSLYGELTRPPEPRPARAPLSPAARRRRRRASTSWSSGSGWARTSTRWPRSCRWACSQRLSLAVAVLHEPQILILDEPTSGVDPVARDSFWELLDRPLAQAGRHDLRDHALHERRDALRPHLPDERGQGAGLRRPRKLIDQPRRRRPGGRLHRLHGGRRRPGAAHRRTRTEPTPTPRPSRRPPPRRPPRTTTMPGPGSAWDGCSPTPRNETMQILRDPVRLACSPSSARRC